MLGFYFLGTESPIFNTPLRPLRGRVRRPVFTNYPFIVVLRLLSQAIPPLPPIKYEG